MVTFWKLTKGFSWICDGSRWIVSTFCGYLASKPRLHQWLARAEWLSFWMKAERKTSKRDQLFDGAVDGKKEWAKFKEAEQTQAHTLEFSFSDMAMVQRAARTLQRDASASLVSRFGDYYSARDNRTVLLIFSNIVTRDSFWENKLNVRETIDEIGRHCQVNEFTDWYNVNSEVFSQTGGLAVLMAHGSIMAVLCSAYPEYPWKPWLFKNPPKKIWREPQIKFQFIGWLGDELGYKEPEDWYNLNQEQIIRHGGKALLSVHESYLSLLKESLPEILDGASNLRFWHNKENRKAYIAWLSSRLGYTSTEDLYNLTQKAFISNYGSGFLAFYKNSIFRLLVDLYPEVDWKPWKLSLAPKEFWKDPKVLREMVSYIEEKLQIQNLNDWYRISRPQLASIGVFHSINKSGGLAQILTTYYTDYQWNVDLLIGKSTRKKSGQRQMYLAVCELYPGEEVYEDYLHPDLRFTAGRRMELDVFVPSRSLAFEYQGIQHYTTTDFFGKAEVRIGRDIEKKKACQARNIRLIDVPYWLKINKQSILELLNKEE